MSEDVDYVSPLTPEMFLREIPESGVPDIDTVDREKLSKRAKYLQKIGQRRSKFRIEYLGQLRQQSIKNYKDKPLSVGEIVLLEDNSKKHAYWNLARVLKLISDRDGHIRLALIKTEHSEFLRPVQRVVKSFETDKEFLQSVIDGVLAEKADKIEQEKFKLESEKAKIEFEKKIKLEQLKKELELTNAKCKLSPAQEKSEHFESVRSDIENLIKSIKTLTIPVPSNTEAYNLFFQSLEKAFKTKNVEDKFKAEILLNMLGEKVGNLMIYVKQEELGDYEKIKQLVLKQLQPTPRVLLNQFRRSQKLPKENYVQFASRIEAMFDYYCESRDIALKQLNALWTRLIRDPQYLKLYRDFIHEYDQLGHMKEVAGEHDNSEAAYYMPHHGVLLKKRAQ
ncbi:integrase catalytic domain-containing protein [Trichonephila clavipes]|uniref:Integrase catalytic domain-containing protein n=1 Tax=Trichonephila clavipes TaxID=2585209 RepID=A0A8X7BD13_TRICX|nr:integrase catalytic domain-containing protein [Trichonephila clavipes]